MNLEAVEGRNDIQLTLKRLIVLRRVILGNVLQPAIQDAAQVVERGRIYRLVFPQFING